MDIKVSIPIAILLLFSANCVPAQEQLTKKEKAEREYTFGTASSGGTGKFYLGREIARVMGASNSAWLDRGSRPQEENTQLAIDKIEIPPSGVIAEIGAGTGYYTFKLAKKVPDGKVYAVEIQDQLMGILNERKQKQTIRNVEVIKGGDKTPNLPANAIDLAIMVDVYHKLECPVVLLQM